MTFASLFAFAFRASSMALFHGVGRLGRDDDAFGSREELGGLEDLELIVGDGLDDVGLL